jgi:hypothetical protein
MDITAVLAWLKSSHLATGIRDSLYFFPLLEAFHVLGLGLVFGMTVVLDFRLLGFASVRRPVTRVMSDIMKWTWMAFTLTVITGILMFITNADVYYHNFFFRTKMLLLALAGVNMLIFELTSGRVVHRWTKDATAPLAGRTAAVLSLLLWITIIFMGRWIGFTTSKSSVPLAPDVNFDELFTPPANQGGAPK